MQLPADDLTLPDAELQRLDSSFALQSVVLADGVSVDVRRCAAAQGGRPVIVALHGIGSGAASWLNAAQALEGEAEFVAWDAPGYGGSTPLAANAPAAADYAARLAALLDALGIQRCLLVGHSLGAITAAAAVRAGGPLASRVGKLMLISPARGYGAPERSVLSARVRQERLQALATLGIEGSARQRSGRLLSAHADALAQRWVRWNMARLNERGYAQAIELLCRGDLMASLPPAVPVEVAVGALDLVTPPADCALVAAACGVPLKTIDAAGHASYVEQPAAVAALLRSALA